MLSPLWPVTIPSRLIKATRKSASDNQCRRSLLAERLEDRTLLAVDFAWGHSMGSSEFSEEGQSVAVDNAGGLYVLSKVAQSSDGVQVTVTKFNSATKAVIWSQPLGSATDSATVFSGRLAVDSGSVYVASERDFDILVASLDASSGAVNWNRQYDSIRHEWDGARAVAAGPDGVYVAGFFSGSIDLGGVALAGSGFLAKLDPATGDTLAAVTLDAADGSVGDQKMGLAISGSTVIFAGGSVFAKFASDLSVLQRQTWSPPVYETSGVSAKDVAVDGQGNIVITGSFQGTVDLDPGPGAASFTSVPKKGDKWHPVNGPSIDTFVLKVQADNALAWVRTFGGGGADFPFSLALDSLGNVYTTGSFQQKVDFDPGAGQFMLTSQPTNIYGTNDAYISILSASGDFVWAGAISGNSNLLDGDAGIGIAVDSEFSIYVTGVYTGTADLNPGKAKFTVTSQGGRDAFLIKLTQTGLAAPTQTSASQTGDASDAELSAFLAEDVSNSRRRSRTTAPAVDNVFSEGMEDDLLASLVLER